MVPPGDPTIGDEVRTRAKMSLLGVERDEVRTRSLLGVERDDLFRPRDCHDADDQRRGELPESFLTAWHRRFGLPYERTGNTYLEGPVLSVGQSIRD